MLRDPRVTRPTEEELPTLSHSIRDRNYRIVATEEAIHLMNRDVWLRDDDPFAIWRAIADGRSEVWTRHTPSIWAMNSARRRWLGPWVSTTNRMNRCVGAWQAGHRIPPEIRTLRAANKMAIPVIPGRRPDRLRDRPLGKSTPWEIDNKRVLTCHRLSNRCPSSMSSPPGSRSTKPWRVSPTFRIASCWRVRSSIRDMGVTRSWRPIPLKSFVFPSSRDTNSGSAVTVPPILQQVRERLSLWNTPAHPGLPPFQGGAAGLLAYELNHQLESLPLAHHDEFQVPAIVLGCYDVVVAWDHCNKGPG